jgi:hypothetical protein
VGLPDNTKSFGPFYRWKGPVWPQQFPVSIAVTREIEPPWRRGYGLTLKWGRREGRPYAYAVGIWKRGAPPPQEPRREDFQYVLDRARQLDTLHTPTMEIRDWRTDLGDGE